MVRPHTKNVLLKDCKINIRMEANVEPTDRKTKDKMADDVCSCLKVMNVNNQRELALSRKAWHDLVEKAKT
jgi:hypothetical protein